MSKLALICTVLMLALTGVAFVHDRSAHTAPAVLPEPAPPTPAAASAPMPEPSSTPLPLLSAAVLKERVQAEIVRPLEGPKGIERYSRRVVPVRKVLFRWIEPPTSDAPTPRFELYENGNPFSRAMRREKLGTGRIDRTTGRITLSIGPDGKPVDVATGLRALGVH